MKEQDKKMVLPKLDDLFTSQEQRDNPVVDEVKEIELYKIGEFPDHPFRVIDDDKMEEMVKSVKEHGVLLPVIVRKRGEGNYQMISGHRRKRACELAGIDKIKCIVKELTDDEATILMVDSNIQREEILPSEKAFAYKMKLEAMKHQGKRVDLEENETSRPLDGKLESAKTINCIRSICIGKFSLSSKLPFYFRSSNLGRTNTSNCQNKTFVRHYNSFYS